jgi:hypothetical protein
VRSTLLAELRGLCDGLPVPDGSWHPYGDLIGACRADFEHALALAAEDEDVLEALASLLAEDSRPALPPDVPAGLAAAWQRLRALPLPAGRHPYLVEILGTLDALGLLLAAVGRVPAAAARMGGSADALAA